MPQGELLWKENVIRRTKDGNGDAMVSCDPNIFLNTLSYHVEFSDGDIKDYSDKVIAENMHSQVDEGSHCTQIMD